MGNVQVVETTIAQVQAAMRSGELTARELVQAYLDRIAAYDKSGPELNSIITLNEKALEEADLLDAEFKRTGELVGSLHGIPVLVKDQAETAGIMTTFGSTAIDGYVPEKDATVIGNLRRSGAADAPTLPPVVSCKLSA